MLARSFDLLHTLKPAKLADAVASDAAASVAAAATIRLNMVFSPSNPARENHKSGSRADASGRRDPLENRGNGRFVDENPDKTGMTSGSTCRIRGADPDRPECLSAGHLKAQPTEIAS